MGLDITAYQNLTKVENPELDQNGNPKDWNKQFRVSLTSEEEKHFNRSEGLEDGAVYATGATATFRAGSYGGYNQWREQLARLAGYKSAEDCWNNHESGPFWEIINFSDCEGTIGPVVARKLVNDFAEFKGRAQVQDEYFFRKYCDWEKAVCMAANNGAVDFH